VFRDWTPARPGAGSTAKEPSAHFVVPQFEAIYQQYFDFVWSSVKRLGVGADSMDDVVQEVFIVVHSRLHTLQRPEALRSWLYGIVRRTVSGHRRANHSKLTRESSAAAQDAPPEPTPLELTERAGELRLLAKLLSGLDEAKREVFLLVELDEMSVPEAAEALGIPLNTAYSRLRAARSAFEAALTRHAPPTEGAMRRCQS
jgi:RNA polymerase sigma-70 factor, ECF subfamily